MAGAFDPPSAREALVIRDLLAAGELNGHARVELGFPWRILRTTLVGGTGEERRARFLTLLAQWEFPAPAVEATLAAVLGASSPERARTADYGFATQSAIDLLATEFPPLAAVVPGLFYEGSTLLCGSPKSGKSLLLYGLGIAVASGGYVLGQIAVERAEVLYLCLEDGPRRAQRRLAKILAGRPMPAGLELVYRAPTLGDGLVAGLGRYLDDHPATKLVLIDTLAKVRRVRDRGGGSAVQIDYEELEPLTTCAQERRIALVIVHHTRKLHSDDAMDMVNATQGAGASVDTVAVLQRTRNGDGSATLAVMGRDLDEEQEYGLRYDATISSYTLVGDAATVRLNGERKAVLDVLRGAGAPLSIRDVADGCGQAYTTVKQRLFQMRQAGEVVSVGGKYALPTFG
jgi:hypothetical protein